MRRRAHPPAQPPVRAAPERRADGGLPPAARETAALEYERERAQVPRGRAGGARVRFPADADLKADAWFVELASGEVIARGLTKRAALLVAARANGGR